MQLAPFFIVGSQRSGTTMLRLIMDAHPELFVPFESDFLAVERKYSTEYQSPQDVEEAYSALLNETLTKKGQFLEQSYLPELIKSKTFHELFSTALSIATQKAGKQRWGIKTPGYHIRIDSLWRLFPGAKFIHIIRDGRAIAHSQRNIEWGEKNVMKLAMKWDNDLKLANKMGAMIPNNYLEIRYEDLVRDTDKVTEQVCQFIDVKFDQSMLDYYNSSRKKMPAESMQWHKNSVSKPDINKIDEWKTKLSKSDRKIFQGFAYNSLARMGYEVPPLSRSLFAKLKEVYYLQTYSD
ncbi:sulfotransferase family protein [Thalassotalea euphylliae]|uniref:Sulfotransferase n=1 Tax=Thalassotalea euphylliae TaxID=1655234 RepID=A0A3E0UBL3_9GAMM|nr:sulfotransferase [Thalassotalea euphylliae]REL33983.1 sulfotransferase [Thalassotalea euphylliae]